MSPSEGFRSRRDGGRFRSVENVHYAGPTSPPDHELFDARPFPGRVVERDALVDGSRDHAKAATDDAKSANEEDARVMVESGEGAKGKSQAFTFVWFRVRCVPGVTRHRVLSFVGRASKAAAFSAPDETETFGSRAPPSEETVPEEAAFVLRNLLRLHPSPLTAPRRFPSSPRRFPPSSLSTTSRVSAVPGTTAKSIAPPPRGFPASSCAFPRPPAAHSSRRAPGRSGRYIRASFSRPSAVGLLASRKFTALASAAAAGDAVPGTHSPAAPARLLCPLGSNPSGLGAALSRPAARARPRRLARLWTWRWRHLMDPPLASMAGW